MRTGFTERSGVLAIVSDRDHTTIDRLISEAVDAAPWRGQVNYLERVGPVTIVATGDAHVHDDGRLLAVCHGRLDNPNSATAVNPERTPQPGETAENPASILASQLAPARESTQPDLPPGAYTVIVLDRANGTLRAARSVGGCRPLAWSSGPYGTAIATEPRQSAILATGKSVLDHDVGRRYKTLEPLEPIQTFHLHTRWMTPGAMLQIDQDRTTHLSIRRPQISLEQRPVDEVVQQLRAALRQSVSSALSGAGVIGSMATGGLDCSSLIGYAAEHQRVTIAASTVVEGVDGSLDEARLAEKSVSHLVDQHVITEIAIADLFDGLTAALPTVEPPAGVLLGLMSTGYQTVAEHGAQTTLDGIGGDELFGLDPLRDAVADHDIKRVITELRAQSSRYRQRPRSFLGDTRKVLNIAGSELLSHNNHPKWIWNRYNNWRLQVDGVARNRLAATLGLRLETPYLNEAVLRAAATIPLNARMANRELQRQVVSEVLAHAHQPMKVHGSDAQSKHFGLDVIPATAAAKTQFYNQFVHQQQEQHH